MSGGGGEDVAPVEGRDTGKSECGTWTSEQIDGRKEQSVVGADHPTRATVRLNGHAPPVRPNTRVDHSEHDARTQVRNGTCQRLRPAEHVERRYVVGEVDNRCARSQPLQHGVDYTDELIHQPVVRQEENSRSCGRRGSARRGAQPALASCSLVYNGSLVTVVYPSMVAFTMGGHMHFSTTGIASAHDSEVASLHDGETGKPEQQRSSRSVQAIVVVVIVYLALAVAIYWNVWSTHPTTVSEVGGDQYGALWFLEWTPFALLHGHNPFFSNWVNYPFGVNLLTNTSVPLLGVLASPVTLLFGPIASFNTLMTLSLAGSATAGYFFVLRWTTWRPAAFIGGLLYGFSPYQIAQSSGHLNLVFVVLPPLILLVVHEVVVRQQGSARRWGIGLGLLVVGQFFISSEILVSTIIIGAICVVAAALIGYRAVHARLRHAIIGLAWAAGVAVVLLAYPIWFTVRGPGHIHGAIQLVPQGYRADLLGPVLPDHLMRIAPAHWAQIAGNFSNSVTENGSYLGITLLLVLAVGTVVLWRRSAVLRIGVIGGVAAFIISLGGGLVVDHGPGGTATGFPLPERLFTKIPLLSNTIPARYSLYVALAAALVLGIILDQLHTTLMSRSGGWGRSRSQSWLSIAVPAVVAVIALVPLVPVMPFEGVAQIPVPEYFTSSAVDHIPVNSVAVLYPYPSSAVPIGQAWQAIARMHFKTPGGYFLVPEGPEQTIAFSPSLSYTRTTVAATVFVALSEGTPPAKTAALRAAVLAEFRSWHVQSLVASPDNAVDPLQAVAYLTWLIGRPPVRDHDVYAWYHLN